jgi:hypothetical protein
MLGFLSSALGGTILGKVLSFGDKWFESLHAPQER